MGYPIALITGTGRAAWASYLVNGDDSGIDAAERSDADSFAAWLGGRVVDCGAESYVARPDYPAGGLLGDCVTYLATEESTSC